MIRRSTLIVLIILAALIAFSFYLKNQQARQAARPAPTESSAALFTTADGSPTDIKIEAVAGSSVEFGRDATGTWVVKAPLAVPADQAASEAAATQVTGLRVLSGVQLGLDVVGLDKPTDTLTVTFRSGNTHKLLIGSVTPIQNGYYCQLDGGSVTVIDKLGVDALLGLLTSPPYLATLTPVASATLALTLTATPAQTATPGSTAAVPPASATPASSTQSAAATATP